MSSASKTGSVTIGVDLGGSHVTAMLVEEDGTVPQRSSYDLTDLSFASVVKHVSTSIRDVQAKAGAVNAVGVGAPGNIDLRTGLVRYSPNFHWRDEPLGEALRSIFDVPVFIANDARCATLGEHTYGSGKGLKNFVLLTLGTGLGGHRGRRDAADRQ